MRIGEQIKNYRKTVGLTQEQVANYLGVSTPAVNKWEKGNTYPDISLLPVSYTHLAQAPRAGKLSLSLCNIVVIIYIDRNRFRFIGSVNLIDICVKPILSPLSGIFPVPVNLA